MIQYSLNGQWEFKNSDTKKWSMGKVPGTLLSDLYNSGKIDDPFWRDNEAKVYNFFKNDYEYQKTFLMNREQIEFDKIILNFDGLDTIAGIFVNGEKIASTSNMHRTYKFDVKEYLVVGTNTIKVYFYSSLNYVKNKNKEFALPGNGDSIEGHTHLRKAHYMFGWDWAPKLPDIGIWKDVYLEFYSMAKWKDVYVRQLHEKEFVKLIVKMEVDNVDKNIQKAELILTSPIGKEIRKEIDILESSTVNLEIDKPYLWWPRGFGDQFLYKLECNLFRNDVVIDTKKMSLGLRELTVNIDSDQWGEQFAFEVNGKKIFSMGANYIPEDSLLGNTSKEKTKQLIEDCARANFNTIRVWGGGIYPSNYFYELCDQYGIIVWQDLMFACGFYDLQNEDFIKETKEEIKDNLKRIRNHPSLGVICGNNEIEMFFGDGRIEATEKNKEDYIHFFEEKIFKVVKQVVPDAFYWPSSPSSGGNFYNTNSEDMGDGHNWDVWHGNEPFTAYRETFYRYMSEFGFESLPDIKTIESFTNPEDRNLFSYIMERHQKNQSGNTKILSYLAENFKYPKDFSSLVYVSQVLQAEAMRYGVEHWRRNRGRCMGTLYWQLNDCWPVSSWSSIDYYGRWKASHYAAQKFYAPVLLSAKENGRMVEFHVSNETLESWAGQIKCSLLNKSGVILQSDTSNVNIEPLSTEKITEITYDFIEDSKDLYVSYQLIEEDQVLSVGSVLFVPTKHFNFDPPNIKCFIDEDKEDFIIKLTSESFAKFVELKLKDYDVVFSDNYFDLNAGNKKKVFLKKNELSQNISVLELKKQLQINSIYSTYD